MFWFHFYFLVRYLNVKKLCAHTHTHMYAFCQILRWINKVHTVLYSFVSQFLRLHLITLIFEKSEWHKYAEKYDKIDNATIFQKRIIFLHFTLLKPCFLYFQQNFLLSHHMLQSHYVLLKIKSDIINILIFCVLRIYHPCSRVYSE